MKFGIWLFVFVVHHNRMETEQSEGEQGGKTTTNGNIGEYCGLFFLFLP